MATIATICTLLAPLPATQALAISVMSNMLNGAAVLLAASLSLSAYMCSQLDSVPSTTTARATSLATGTIAIIVAIVASGSQSVVGLYFAVCVAALNGVAWFAWARHSSAARGRQDPA